MFTATDAQGVYDDFMSRIDDDLDTPGALAILDEIARPPILPGQAAGDDINSTQIKGQLRCTADRRVRAG
jgi:hypothetical protein